MKTKNAPVKTKSAKKETVKAENKEANFKPQNIVILTGNIGKDPVVQTTKNGKKKAFFPLATNTYYIDKTSGERKSNTLWHSLVAWGSLAEKIETSIKNGDRICVTGRINTREYADKAGIKKTFTEIVMRSLDIVQTKMPVVQ